MNWLTLADFCIFSLIAFTCFFQAYYLIHSLSVSVDERRARPASAPEEKISIIIPLYNSARTIGRCLGALLENNLSFVADLVIVLDHPTDDSEAIARSFAEQFRAKGVDFKVVELPASKFGKVAAILEGGQHIRRETVLLIDADIIFDPAAIEELVAFHTEQHAVFSSCLIYPYQESGRSSFITHLICNNRLYRQGVLQSVKSRYGVANFPGGVELVDFARYRALLVDGFLEDLVATYRVLSQGGTIAILPRVLAYEVERQTIRGLFLQRTRWTIGAIENVPAQIRTARARAGLNQKILINSYHVMWELQHYVITLGMMMAALRWHAAPYFLAPAVLYALQIARSAYIGRRHYRNSIIGIALHCVFYPMILTAALIGAGFLLIKSRRFFFRSQVLFSRE